ncbi:MAG: hypothetical protein GWN79_28280, partial [Actinobacteria bacterium]|nr:hypothetical protein [Actinomycetota bacterium]NIS37102.1 hypothetical protein [Actinomycetota bacterium]NIU22698.1 hypothetical protein [Actinomycetota bacterium]NIU71566.1 hypothetical protein [Actinomycetota bacterium]NIV90909.1 hypothetical protein [Actinomycetota bacterium]
MESIDTIEIITRKDREPTPLEALFAAAGLPAHEVEACPVPDCEICHPTLP